jgi:hypothetical protein
MHLTVWIADVLKWVCCHCLFFVSFKAVNLQDLINFNVIEKEFGCRFGSNDLVFGHYCRSLAPATARQRGKWFPHARCSIRFVWKDAIHCMAWFTAELSPITKQFSPEWKGTVAERMPNHWMSQNLKLDGDGRMWPLLTLLPSWQD